ncbi:ATP-binding cassette domain-containing protein [Agrobacterium vitis]|nr:ABC transporter ATP-binding protein [Allorhizobium ampelinum]MUO91684.1 ATP-binding cassette domain-containing protein [Agrobacterium vitis]MUZ55230.1 ATP-binding cassette domain-containing protein [Agrobacterium vitis]MUZ94498.1 ATP-binding cassette domain-containing protein [Agrobacterium vitis]MVA42817.1 ATP-binding cassette domain-containing protein [Agrobacterium vitis]
MGSETSQLPILSCERMSCTIAAKPAPLQVLHDINFSVPRRTTLGIVGESGAGKSMLIKSIMGIAPTPVRVEGRIVLDGIDLSTLKPKARSQMIGRKVGIVFQNPMTSLNPFASIGRQIEEAGRFHLGLSRAQAQERAIELLTVVGIADAKDCYGYFPHQFSGGMKQRIMIATALMCHPDLLIADEATTALDVTVQKEVLDLLQILQEERQMSMILVSHNLGVVAGRTDNILVLYGGHIVEAGPTAEVFRNPRHPYTGALLSAMPRMDQPAHARLHTIPGQPPSLANQPKGCPFAPRCPSAQGPCHDTMPPMTTDGDHHFACHFPLIEASALREVSHG